MLAMSFNVNGIRARVDQLSWVLEKHQPDVLGLQEIKVVDELFPVDFFEERGLNVVFFGQKGHYGVALVSPHPISDVQYGWHGDPPDAQRRVIMGTVLTPNHGAVPVINGYFPQGESRSHETKFPAKEKYYRDLLDHLQTHCDPGQPLIVMGDYNVAPEDTDIGIGDKNAQRWLRTGKCSFLPEERQWIASIRAWGLADSYRLKRPDDDTLFSWFDYRSRAFQGDPKRGLRIDHLFVTKPLQPMIEDVGIDYQTRGMVKSSDHAPVWTRFKG